MAEKIRAITAYLPRIVKGDLATVKDVSDLIAGRTSMNPGSVSQALEELKYSLNFYLKKGQPVRLPGIGLFTASMKLDGTVNVNLRVDKELLSELNKDKNGFTGTVLNADMIGKTSDELVILWNEENPDDKVA
ncbi:MAG: hypothetical protein GY940_25565 [bacterium]|nr:hypothetical protein [bacterium]